MVQRVAVRLRRCVALIRRVGWAVGSGGLDHRPNQCGLSGRWDRVLLAARRSRSRIKWCIQNRALLSA